jgi:ATP/maltotriose-dependent transcriptional regulator MalT
VQASIDDAREIGSRRDLTFALDALARIRLSHGELGVALAAVEEAVTIARELGIPRAEMVALTGRADIQRELGDPGYAASIEAASAISDALGGRFFRPPIRAHLAALALDRGDPAEADRLLGEAFAQAGEDWFQVVWAAHGLVMASEARGDADRLEDAATRIDAVQGDAVTVWTLSARYARALAALLRGEPEPALRTADEAHAVATAMDVGLARWRLDRVAWHALDALGRPDEGSARRASAEATLREQLATVPDERRPGFLARPLVADVLGG